MTPKIDPEFVGFCREATDSQLEVILQKEWASCKHRDYRAAEQAASERGWIVKNGRRLP